eukprot:489363-Prymnesium_polylepis.1
MPHAKPPPLIEACSPPELAVLAPSRQLGQHPAVAGAPRASRSQARLRCKPRPTSWRCVARLTPRTDARTNTNRHTHKEKSSASRRAAATATPRCPAPSSSCHLEKGWAAAALHARADRPVLIIRSTLS